MSVQQHGGKGFSPSLMALAVCLASSTAAFAAEAEKTAPLELGATQISTEQLGQTTEGTQSYTTGEMATATKLPLTMRETPQAVTVITRQRMDDQNLTTLSDVMDQTTGITMFQGSMSASRYLSRGFEVTSFPEVHALGKAKTDVFGAANAWGLLQDGGNKDQGTFRVPESAAHTPKFLS